MRRIKMKNCSVACFNNYVLQEQTIVTPSYLSTIGIHAPFSVVLICRSSQTISIARKNCR